MTETVEKPVETRPVARRKRRWRRIFLVPILLALIFGVQYLHNWTNDSLLAAVMEGDLDRVHQMLSLRADPNTRMVSPGIRLGPVTAWDRFLALFGVRRTNQRTDRWRTALMLAAGGNRADIVMELLAHGADPNIKLYNGATALSYCGAKANPAVAITLINHGANVNVRTHEGVTPMLQASIGGKVDVIKALLDHGANIHEQGPNGESPLMLAALSLEEKAVAYLLEHGANLDDIHALPLPSQPLSTAGPLFVGIQSRGGSGGMMASGGGFAMGDVTSDRSQALMAASSPMNFAAFTGSKRLLNLAWDQASESDRKGKLGMQSLVTAIETRHHDMAVDLIQRGVRFNTEKPGEPDPLYAAVSNSDIPLVTWLLNHGVKPENPSTGRQPAIIAAARTAHSEQIDKFGHTRLDFRMMQLLLSHGADINARDPNSGETAIFAAYNPELLAVLLARGARVDVTDKTGRTPLHAAYDIRTAGLLLDRDADPNVADSTGSTPLLRAAQMRTLPLLRLLLSRGAKPNVIDRFGNSPLRVAQQTSWAEGVAELKKVGAKVVGPPALPRPVSPLAGVGR